MPMVPVVVSVVDAETGAIKVLPTERAVEDAEMNDEKSVEDE